ncbi:hypothetical protein JCM16161A_03310 [Vulcanisaeta sp. JCM 16161]
MGARAFTERDDVEKIVLIIKDRLKMATSLTQFNDVEFNESKYFLKRELLSRVYEINLDNFENLRYAMLIHHHNLVYINNLAHLLLNALEVGQYNIEMLDSGIKIIPRASDNDLKDAYILVTSVKPVLIITKNIYTDVKIIGNSGLSTFKVIQAVAGLLLDGSIVRGKLVYTSNSPELIASAMPIFSDFINIFNGKPTHLNFQVRGATLTVDGKLHPSYALMSPPINGLNSYTKETFMKMIATNTGLLFAYATDGLGNYDSGIHVGYAVSDAYKINNIPAPKWLAKRIEVITSLPVKYIYDDQIRFDEENARVFAWLILRELSEINNTAIRLPLTLFYRIHDLINHVALSYKGKALASIDIKIPLSNGAKSVKLHTEYRSTYRFNIGVSFAEETKQFVEHINAILKEFNVGSNLNYYLYSRGAMITVPKGVLPAFLGIANFSITPQSNKLISTINTVNNISYKAYEVFQRFAIRNELLEYLNYIKEYGNPYHFYSESLGISI